MQQFLKMVLEKVVSEPVLRIRNDFVPDPDPAFNFPSSGSGSRQKFRIHADPDPTYINKVPIFRNNTKTPLKFIQKEESLQIFALLYSILLSSVQ